MAGKKIVRSDDEIEFSVCSFEGICAFFNESSIKYLQIFIEYDIISML